MNMRKILGCIRKADEKYNMINDGEHICIAVSGGKDSMLLLKSLKTYQYFSKSKFKLSALSIDLGFENMDFSKLGDFCKELNTPLYIKRTNITDIIFKERKERNPCSLCTKMKRGALNNLTLSLGSNKLALGHHKDDYIESFLLSLFYEGRIHTFKPITYLDRKQVYAIRPLIYANETDIQSVIKKENIPVIKSTCPANGYTKREEMKDIIKELKKDIIDVNDKMFTAVMKNQNKHPEDY